MQLKQKQIHVLGWVITAGVATIRYTHEIDFKVHTRAGCAQLTLGPLWCIVNWGRKDR